MDGVTALGLVAGALTSLSFAPQVLKAWRSKRMDDVSPVTLASMGIGLVLWIAYGYLRSDLALIVANIVGLALTSTLLAMWWSYGRP